MRFLVLLVLIGACDRSPSKEKPVVVADPKQASAAHDAKEWKKCAELWMAVAATTRGEAQGPPLYDAACCQAQAGHFDAAFDNLEHAIGNGFLESGMETDPDLFPLHKDPRWPKLLATLRYFQGKADAAVVEPALRHELLDFAQADRVARAAALKLDDPVRVSQTIDEIDERTTAWIKVVVAKHGWPGRTLVGKDGAHAAWQLVQASPDLAFQKECLEKLELAVAQGEATPAEHAYLYDRVAVQSGKPQRWGTQFKDTKPFPIEDEAHVDGRRKAIGLPSMAEYAKQLRETEDPE